MTINFVGGSLLSGLFGVFRRNEHTRSANETEQQTSRQRDQNISSTLLAPHDNSCFQEILSIHDELKRSLDSIAAEEEHAGGQIKNALENLKQALTPFRSSFQSLGCDVHTSGSDRSALKPSPLPKRKQSQSAGGGGNPSSTNAANKCGQGIQKLDDLIGSLRSQLVGADPDTLEKLNVAIAAASALKAQLVALQSLLNGLNEPVAGPESPASASNHSAQMLRHTQSLPAPQR
jgi:hypothetical protein